ncbi:MAG: glycosyltransferase [Planctomycetota bacterium]
MRAVHVVTRLNVGGIARYLESASDAVDVLVRGQVEADEQEAAWDGAQHVLEGMRRSVRPLDDRRAVSALEALLRRLEPDVVHTHASKAGFVGRVAARRLGIPVVHTFHGHVLRGYFGPLRSRLFQAIERRLARGAHLTATGPACARELESLLRRPVSVLPPGIALSAAPAGARGRWRRRWGDPQRVALQVGRAAAVKRHDRFVGAARAAGYLPVIAGATGVPGALCLGVVDAMEEIYAAVDVVVCASDREGTPFALLEAMAAGVPIVARPVGDVPWIVGDAGVLADDLAAALRALPEGLGARGRERVARLFPADAVAPRLRALYRSIV